MSRTTLAVIVGALVCVATAQVEHFGVVRDAAYEEVVAQLSTQQSLTRLVDEYEQDLLMYAAAGNTDPNVVRYLVSLGFDVNRSTSTR